MSQIEKKVVPMGKIRSSDFLAWSALESYKTEYTNRICNKIQLPSSFEAVGDFFSINKKAPQVRYPSLELHYLDFVDFFEFATSELSTVSENVTFEEGPVFIYEGLTPIGSFPFVEDDREHVVAGVAVRRHGHRTNILLVGGIERFDEELSPTGFKTVEARKPRLHIPEEYSDAPTRLAGTDFQQVIVVVSINEKPDAVRRNVFLDYYGTQSVLTDDVGWMRSQRIPEETVQNILGRIDEYRTLVDLALLMRTLPSYFNFMIDLVIEEAPSKPSDPQKRGKKRKKSKKDEDVIYRFIKTLRVTRTKEEKEKGSYTYSPPLFQVDVSGHWRRLKEPWQVGKGPNEEPVYGKTWVKEHVRYKDKDVLTPDKPDKKPRTIAIKESIQEAKARAEDLVKKSSAVSAPNHEPQQSEKESPPRSWQYEERKKLTSHLRYLVLRRDEFRCKLCGADAVSDKDVRLAIDHITPISRWGRTILENLRTLCNRCNGGKSAMLDTETC